MSVKTFTKLIIQKHSVSIKDLELFNNDCAKWKQFKQAVNNKFHHNTDHYSNYNNKINYINFYLNNKINCILNHKQNSNNHLNFKIYSDLLSFFNKYYQDHLQNETDIQKWKVFHIKHNDQFLVFWMKFTILIHKIEILFNNISEQLVNLLIHQLWKKLLNQLTETHLIANYNI